MTGNAFNIAAGEFNGRVRDFRDLIEYGRGTRTQVFGFISVTVVLGNEFNVTKTSTRIRTRRPNRKNDAPTVKVSAKIIIRQLGTIYSI